ncbi:platelet-activating factor acetylhydrolase, isoform II-domain-containing protein [Parachaetomium inaequale]|uniref:1-alkyl-2-acetylglycerophosphocholine esterase n=1 Tax=Parachaetomium inaequale TaxID=2588326 RepID=A0AAN6PG55_9PEZI|nr:platelet-activating factor acetylhydrolase, isoform II-domain-containing protein [Parachaetomium inaequale]
MSNPPSPSPSPSPSRPPPTPKPRKTLRDYIQHTLPAYTGPYQVGFLELELPARRPRAFSPHIKRNNEFALKLDTVLVAVYYPADLDAGSGSDSSRSSADLGGEEGRAAKDGGGVVKKQKQGRADGDGERAAARHDRRNTLGNGARKRRRNGTTALSRVPWLPRPRGSTCKGYAKFFNVPHWPFTAYMAVTTMFTKLPAYRNARLSRRWPGAAGEEQHHHHGAYRAGYESGETLVEGNGDDEKKKHGPPRFPVVIFSHGLGGSRTLYSSICGELASFGLVVVAVEHRDGSGARTFVNKAGKAEDLESQGMDKTAGPLENEKKKKKPRNKRRQEDAETKPYYKIDYLFPKDNAQDTSPHNPNGVDKELRGAQIEMRLAEVEEAFYVLGLINSGKGDKIRRDNLRKGDHVGSSSVGLDGIDWQDWAGRLDLKSVTMMGHSFGGATAVQALRSDKLSWITQGILLDPWGPATPECTEQKSVHKPVLSIGSEAFMHWAENFHCVEQVCNEARAAGTLSWMTTIRGSTHLSQTDFAVLYPNWMSLLIKTIVDPERAIYLTVHSALEFLKLTLPATQTRFAGEWADEQLLSRADSETKVVSDHRPDDKWVAARLKIPNEFSMRLRSLLPWNASLASPKALVNQGVGNGMWCHQSPGRDSVERYMRRNGRLPISSSPEGVIA